MDVAAFGAQGGLAGAQRDDGHIAGHLEGVGVGGGVGGAGAAPAVEIGGASGHHSGCGQRYGGHSGGPHKGGGRVDQSDVVGNGSTRVQIVDHEVGDAPRLRGAGCSGHRVAARHQGAPHHLVAVGQAVGGRYQPVGIQDASRAVVGATVLHGHRVGSTVRRRRTAAHDTPLRLANGHTGHLAQAQDQRDHTGQRCLLSVRYHSFRGTVYIGLYRGRFKLIRDTKFRQRQQ
ncbi:hypothetical protein M5D96_004791, partial [Drosophila gunungcola]